MQIARKQLTINFPKKKNLSRTEQRYVSRTAINVNTTDTRLDLFIASWINSIDSIRTLFAVAVGLLQSQLALEATKFIHEEWDVMEGRYNARGWELSTFDNVRCS